MQLAEIQKQEIREIPDGLAGTEATLTHMMQFVREYKINPIIRRLASELTLPLRQKDFAGEARILFEFVRDEIRYLYDVAGIETLQTPIVTLENHVGDCDDKATLLATLLESIGHKTRFVAVAFRRGEIEHVFIETKIGDRWVPMDPTEPVEMGWSSPGVVSRLVRHN